MTPIYKGMCAHHIIGGPEGYVERAEWARRRIKNGDRQKQCRTCRYWFFKEEMGAS